MAGTMGAGRMIFKPGGRVRPAGKPSLEGQNSALPATRG